MSDCIKCWGTPCVCGYDYRNWTEERKAELVQAILVGSKRFTEEEIEKRKATRTEY